jgi:hypothetical protein
MSGQGRVLNIKTTIPPPPLEVYIYAATTAGGVYFTDNFVNETIQPTWVDVSAGLGALDCKEFHIDPFDPLGIQYVLLETSRILYRRNGGAWVEILSPADGDALSGANPGHSVIGGFCLDPTIPGRMWATYGAYEISGGSYVPEAGYYVLRSDDYGNTWVLVNHFFHSDFFYYYVECILSYGDILHISAEPSSVSDLLYHSEDAGVSIARTASQLTTGSGFTKFNWDYLHNTQKIYYYGNRGGDGMHSVEVGAWDVVNGHWDDTNVFLDEAIVPKRLDSMWFDPGDALHQRAIDWTIQGLFATTDGWTTHAAGVDPTPHLISINPVDINGEIIVGLILDHGQNEHHCIGVMTDETDAVPVGIAGTNCDTAPFTDSIPDTIGEICQTGIQAFMA